MIRLEFDDEISRKHRILCPYCKTIMDLFSKIRITKIPGGISFSIDLYAEHAKQLIEKFHLSTIKELKERDEYYKEVVVEG